MSATKAGGVFAMTIASLALASSAFAPGAFARAPRTARHLHRHGWRPPAPSADALGLSEVAPPANLTTTLGTYGDASFARARAQRGEDDRQDLREAPYPCDPRVAEPGGYVCTNVPGRLGYGQYYAFTPAYVSAPQTVVGRDFGRQSPILPPATGLAWALNGLRFDPH